jgi:hypothetical protein
VPDVGSGTRVSARPRVGRRAGDAEPGAPPAGDLPARRLRGRPPWPVRLPPLDQQVVVLTAASSGIGLTTARCAAQCGAPWCSPAALRQPCDELDAGGERRPVAVPSDVACEEDVARTAAAARTHPVRTPAGTGAGALGSLATRAARR